MILGKFEETVLRGNSKTEEKTPWLYTDNQADLEPQNQKP